MSKRRDVEDDGPYKKRVVKARGMRREDTLEERAIRGLCKLCFELYDKG